MFDYVIVGGGSAGCVLANRLSADGQYRVCLLEAGTHDSSPLLRMPAGVIALMRSNIYNWKYWSAPQAQMGQRRLFWPRGRTLGGSSAVNAMCYVRGHAWDYDHWAALGNSGWSYKDVLPYFKRLENFEAVADAGVDFDAFHASGGPLNATRLRQQNALSDVFIEAAQQAGHKPNNDFNGAEQEGIGYYHVAQKNGERCSNARAYLHDAGPRPNLTVVTDVQVTRALLDGKRASGVRYYAQGSYREVYARREVILSAGAVVSPQLLLLSGIGPREELGRHSIAVVHELPGVGKNLQDHLDALVSMRNRSRLSFSFHPMSLLRAIWALLRYAFGRRGELTSNVAEAGGFLKSSPVEEIPDLQIHFAPVCNTQHGQNLTPAFTGYAHSLLCCDLRPLSRGEIRLASTDPLVPPQIDPRHFEDERDLDKLVAAIRKAREIFAQPAFAKHNGRELEPGAALRTDAELKRWLREHAETLYHPVGTCKMGDDPMAVVDARLRVHGLSGLRVVDASIMPTLVGGNTNVPTTMIAEKGADMILEDARAGS